MTDELDLKIINLILDNSKLSYRKLSVRLGVSVATVMNRINRLEKEKIIRKYSAIIDYEKLGFDISVIIGMRAKRGRLTEVEKKIAAHPSVKSIFDVTGVLDIMVFASFKSRKELNDFLKKLEKDESVIRTETKLILTTAKDENIKVG